MMRDAIEDRRLGRRQFILGPEQSVCVPGWKTDAVGSGLALAWHPDLEVAAARVDDRWLVCLGHALDPLNPDRGHAEILMHLVGKSNSFEDFETLTRPLAGRFNLVMGIAGQTRFYPDACGMKSAYVGLPIRDGPCWVGSQPRALAERMGREVPDDREAVPFRTVGDFFWPAEMTPCPGVFRLMPNHYLDLDTGRRVRFWPRTEIRHRELQEAAHEIRELLTGAIHAASRRRKLVMPLTGGYDSRALFACAKPLWPDIDVISIVHPGIPLYDLSIPHRLTGMAGIPFRTIRAIRNDGEFEAIYRENLGGTYCDPSSSRIQSYEQLPDNVFVVPGLVAEVCRSNGAPVWGKNLPKERTAESVARVTGFTGDPAVRSDLEAWLNDVPEVDPTLFWDLAHWEIRVGNWASLGCTGRDTVTEMLPLFNCRAVLEAGLGVAVEHRREPYRLFREVIGMAAPGMQNLPFNRSTWDTYRERAARFCSWKLVLAIESMLKYRYISHSL